MRTNTTVTAASETKPASAARVSPMLCPRVRQCKEGCCDDSDSFHSEKVQITPEVGGGGHDPFGAIEDMGKTSDDCGAGLLC
jgi:hypothetical protein